jgi:hypothetical protein
MLFLIQFMVSEIWYHVKKFQLDVFKLGAPNELFIFQYSTFLYNILLSIFQLLYFLLYRCQYVY